MSMDPPGTGSTVRRIMLGASLRRLREEKGLTREVAGFHIRASESKISRMELGRVGFKTRDVEDLLTLYGVLDDAERRGLLEMVREANTPAGGTSSAICCRTGSPPTWGWRSRRT